LVASSGKRETRFHGGSRDIAHAPIPAARAPANSARRGPPAELRRAGDWQFLCLDHVREFNTGYNYFNGMSTEEIEAAQTPYGGWDRETRAFANAGSPPPRWADFTDPLDAIGARFRRTPPQDRTDGASSARPTASRFASWGLEPIPTGAR
jgi:hypothetical protein